VISGPLDFEALVIAGDNSFRQPHTAIYLSWKAKHLTVQRRRACNNKTVQYSGAPTGKIRMKRIFYNKHNHLRAVWRMIIYVLVGIVVFLPFIPVLKNLDRLLPLKTDDTGPASTVNLVFVFFLNISFLLAGWITLKWIERRPPALLGLNFWFVSLKELTIGLGIGLVNFGAVFLSLLAFGWISVEWAGFTIGNTDVFLLYLATFLVFAGFEELINRGYLFQTLCEGIGVWTAAVIISLIFSLVHIINPAFSILGGVFLFIHGLLYTVAYLKTRSLWTPIGLHMAWNFVQGPVAGMKVSGTAVNHSLFSTETGGPELLTGGNFGVEGGIVAIFISIIILLALLKADWLKPSTRFQSIEKEWADRNKSRQSSLTS
jgi:membrane protease YdiL (CAAX protease family)